MNQNPKFNIINFFFPPFSEIELVSLFYLLFLSLVHRWDLLLSIIFESSSFSLVGIAAIAVGLLVFVNAFSARAISQAEKQIFSVSFYLLLSFLTMYSLISPNTSSTNNSLVDEIEFFIFFYLFFKSFLRIMILRFSTKQISNDISNQMTNKQLRVSELIMIILFAPVLYLLLQANNSFAQVLCLSYFYLTTMINISSRVIRKYSIAQ
jgi:hypothetical protein